MSDKWIEKSIKMANNENYLDRLQKTIYDMQPPEDRELPESTVKKAKKAYQEEDLETLVKAFIEFDKFPYSDTYAAYLRHAEEDVFENNPETVRRIGRRIHDMGIENALARSSRPKESNRQMGGKFEEWFLNLDYRYAEYSDFKGYNPLEDEIVVMSGGESKIHRYMVEELDVEIEKYPDMLAKKNSDGNIIHIIGEAKFLTGFGGHQGRQLSDALNMARKMKEKDNIIGIAVVDGVHLIKIRDNFDRKDQRRIRNADVPVMSALLVEDYLDEI